MGVYPLLVFEHGVGVLGARRRLKSMCIDGYCGADCMHACMILDLRFKHLKALVVWCQEKYP
jgi:hypothetical protein